MLFVPSSIRPYAMALAAVVAALVLRLLLDPVLGPELPFYVFYFAVIVASIRGGLGPGLAALSMSVLAAAYFFAAPRFSLIMNGSGNYLDVFRFITLGAILVVGGNWARSLKAKWTLEVEARRSEKEQARKAWEETENTLASIGDGLITVDAHGRVQFMNPIAERLSGWEAAEARGRSITEVFRIIHQTTRERVPDPVLGSLQEGRVMTLPERTVLIGRTGEERPIDDSAAPIRDAQGRITGSVLVFREIVRKVEDPHGFEISAIELFPAPGSHTRLSKKELDQLEQACRTWIAREWRPDATAVRIVGLNGFSVTIQQETMEALANGMMSVRFLAAYSR